MINNPDQFVIHRLRAKPVEYTVKIRHYVSDGKWMMAVTVYDIEDSERAHLAVADDLRRAAEICEGDKSDLTTDPGAE
jgi:hypothetical protein